MNFMFNFTEEDIACMDLIPSSIKYAKLSCGDCIIKESIKNIMFIKIKNI